MAGNELHLFDLRLCQHVLDVIRCYAEKPAFAAYAEEQIDHSIWEYLQALGGDEPAPLLLRDVDFDDLIEVFEGAFDLPWIAYGPLYRKSIDSAKEIRDALASEYAGEWARVSARAMRKLEEERARLSDGIGVVQAWVREARRLLRAMGATALLPRPVGIFPTPACPDPPSRIGRRAGTGTEAEVDSGDGLVDTVTRMEAIQVEMRDLLLTQRTIKDWYTTDEVAELVGKHPFTVREWCRRARINAEKKGSGCGKHQSWVIAHEELQRIRREGLLPVSCG